MLTWRGSPQTPRRRHHTSAYPSVRELLTPASCAPSKQGRNRKVLFSLIHLPKFKGGMFVNTLKAPLPHTCPNSLAIAHKSSELGRWVLPQEGSHLKKGNTWVRKMIPEDTTRNFLKDFEMKRKRKKT